MFIVLSMVNKCCIFIYFCLGMKSERKINTVKEKAVPTNEDLVNAEDLELENRNNFLSSVLKGDAENLHKCFVDADDPNHEKTYQLLNIHDDIGRNALFAAAMLGHSEVIQALVTRGANVNEQTNRGTWQHCSLISHCWYWLLKWFCFYFLFFCSF